MTGDTLITTREAAELLRCQPANISKLARKGFLRVQGRDRHGVLYLRDECEAYRDGTAVRTTPRKVIDHAPIQVVDKHRQYWLDRYSMEEIRDLANCLLPFDVETLAVAA